jgi:hypothetical protein
VHDRGAVPRPIGEARDLLGDERIQDDVSAQALDGQPEDPADHLGLPGDQLERDLAGDRVLNLLAGPAADLDPGGAGPGEDLPGGVLLLAPDRAEAFGLHQGFTVAAAQLQDCTH